MDDAWINDGFPDSPITKEVPVDHALAPDDDIIRFMVDKLGVSRDQIMTTLKESYYDDVGAIYMLLAEQRRSGKWTPPPAGSNGLSPMSPVHLANGTVTPASRASNMGVIGEDGMIYI
jgi:hypothetical protein